MIYLLIIIGLLTLFTGIMELKTGKEAVGIAWLILTIIVAVLVTVIIVK
jgi:hypothetical protein